MADGARHQPDHSKPSQSEPAIPVQREGLPGTSLDRKSPGSYHRLVDLMSLDPSNAIVLLFRYVRAPHPDDREDLPAIIRISHALTMVISEAEAAIRAIFHQGGYAPPDCGPAIPTDYTRLR